MSKRLFQIGTVPAGAVPITIWKSDQLEDIQPGQVVAPLDDYALVWDENCLPPSQLEPWRFQSDELCDEVVKALDLRPGQDGLEKLLNRMKDGDSPACIQQFWDEIAREPPDGISALPAPGPHTAASSSRSRPASEYTPRSALDNPDTRPRPVLSEGQAVFWRYSAQIFSALLHFSLAGGFSASRIVGVLRETSYLTGEGRDRTYKRLLETTQAIMDYMNDMTPVTGVGWKSAIRVRMLHATVRVRLLSKMGVLGDYDHEKDGIPINQEDLIATLGSFAIAPLWSLRRMGITLHPEEEAAYVATWRHIGLVHAHSMGSNKINCHTGYYLGITPAHLRRHYTSVDAASKLFASNTMHLFSSDFYPDDHRTTSTYRLLSAVSDRPPTYRPVEASLAVSRFLLGDGLADRLAIPQTPTFRWLRMRTAFLIDWALVSFGRLYVSRWEVERVHITRLLVLMVVCWQLGVKRTKFTIKEFAEEIRETVASEGTNGEKEKAAAPLGAIDVDSDELDPEVKMGPEAGKAIIKRWKRLLIEMGVVVVGTGCSVLAGAYGLWTYRGSLHT